MNAVEQQLPVVSVCVITYRHARYIRQCIESILCQRAAFPIEILVGEDDSDDGTREVCLQLAEQYKPRIKVVLQRRADVVYVDGKPRGTYNLVETLKQARGEFVALCEGDDYWTDPLKLEKQVAYLRQNPDCVGCFHEASTVDESGAVLTAAWLRSLVPIVKPKYSQRDCIVELLSSYPTCSLMYRRCAFLNPPEWYMRRSCDFFFDLVITAKGQLGFIDECMAAYRRHPGGVWSTTPLAVQIVEQIVRFKHLLNYQFFFQNYRAELLAQIDRFYGMIAASSDVYQLQAELERLKTLEPQLENVKDLAATTQQLAKERDEMLRLVQKQHHIIQELRAARERPVQERTLPAKVLLGQKR